MLYMLYNWLYKYNMWLGLPHCYVFQKTLRTKLSGFQPIIKTSDSRLAKDSTHGNHFKSIFFLPLKRKLHQPIKTYWPLVMCSPIMCCTEKTQASDQSPKLYPSFYEQPEYSYYRKLNDIKAAFNPNRTLTLKVSEQFLESPGISSRHSQA